MQEEFVMEAPKKADPGDMGGTISEKGLINAFKRAKQTGAFLVSNAGLKVFPEGLCDFLNYKVDDENWWDGNELVRVDLSNNQLEEINGDLANQVTLHTLNF